VRASFRSRAGLTEPKPALEIDYADEVLSGFIGGRDYRFIAGGVSAVIGDGSDINILEAWFGDTVRAVSLKTGPYRLESDTLELPIPARPDAPSGLETVSATETADGKIAGLEPGMRYRRALENGGFSAWTAAAGAEASVPGGTYQVQVAPVTYLSFGSAIVTVVVGAPVSAASSEREIPAAVSGEEAAAAPVRILAGAFTAGPNPAALSAGAAKFFWEGKELKNGTLTVFDAQGNLVKKVSVSDKAQATGRREIGAWNLTDAKGRGVTEGTYIIKGTLAAKDGSKVKVAYTLGAAK
jgi:hypothetical protein